MNDRILVDNFIKTRSEQAFRKLYQEKTPRLYQMALRLTQDTAQSEDLIQEVWIIAARKLADFQWQSELRTWLTGILINTYRHERRKAERAMEVTMEEISDIAAPSPDSNMQADDLERAIGQLPPGYRQIIILHDIEGYKHKEIAEILDITEGTSKSQLFYARRAMREFYNHSNPLEQ